MFERGFIGQRRLARLSLLCLAALSTFLAAGCATTPEDIAPSSTGEVLYVKWSCEQLSEEQLRLAEALAVASDRQLSCRKKDMVGVLFIGLPLASLSGCGVASEIARLKGQIQALQRDAAVINCPLPTTPDTFPKVDPAKR